MYLNTVIISVSLGFRMVGYSYRDLDQWRSMSFLQDDHISVQAM